MLAPNAAFIVIEAAPGVLPRFSRRVGERHSISVAPEPLAADVSRYAHGMQRGTGPLCLAHARFAAPVGAFPFAALCTATGKGDQDQEVQEAHEASGAGLAAETVAGLSHPSTASACSTCSVCSLRFRRRPLAFRRLHSPPPLPCRVMLALPAVGLGSWRQLGT